MAYAILRVEKISSLGSVAAAAGHMTRSRPTPNADPDRSAGNRVLRGTGAPEEDVRSRLTQSGVVVRGAEAGSRRSVVALDVFIGASPEWWATASPQAREQWVDKSLKWLDNHFGPENVCSVMLHTDETSPHITALVTPIDSTPTAGGKDLGARLNAKRWLGGKKVLAAMQDSYAASVGGMGLERGVRGSKAKHQTVRQYYASLQAAVDSAAETVDDAALAADPKAVVAAARHAIAQADKRTAAITETATIAIADRDAARAAWKSETAKLRDLPLTQVAQDLGVELVEKPQKGPGLWGPGGLHVTGQRWHDFAAGVGGGGAVDFVIHARGGNVRDTADAADAIAWLRETYGTEATVSATMAHHQRQVREQVAQAQPREFAPPPPAPEYTERLRKYLYRRGLDPRLFDAMIQRGSIYATVGAGGYVNAVYTRVKGAVSAEVEGMGSAVRYKGQAAGSRPTAGPGFGFVVQSADERIVLVESAVKAMAYAQLHRGEPASIISTGGARPQLPWLEGERRQIVVAYDADAAGDAAAAELMACYPSATRERPQGAKDWDDLLPKPRPVPLSEERDEETLEEQCARYRAADTELMQRRAAEEAQAQLEANTALLEAALERLQEDAGDDSPDSAAEAGESYRPGM